MATTFEKTWQFYMNQQMSTTNTCKNGIWWMKAALKGDISTTLNQGLWTTYYSCDGTTAGTADDRIDRWGTQGGATANTGTVASIVTGATIVGAVRLTGLTGMSSGSVGNFMTISGAASAGNNSKTNTPWRIVNFVSSTSVDVYNPNAVTGDGNNGAITWTERTSYTFTSTNIVQAAAGTAHSWYVLVSPTALGPYYMIIDCDSASVNFLAISFSKTAPTGGTTTARPTSTDEFGFSTAVAYISNSAAPAKWYWNMTLATDGNFHMLGTRGDGQAIFEQALIFQLLADTKSADTFKAAFFTQAAAAVSSLTATKLSTAGNWYARKFDGSAVLGDVRALDAGLTANTEWGDSIDLSDFTDGKYDDMPVYLWNNVAANYTLKGRLYDIRRAPTSIPDGFCEPSPSAPTSMIGGDYWFPTNTPPVL